MGRSLYFVGNQELLTFAHVRVPASPTRLLSSAYLQQQAISQLVNVVAEWGLKGLIIHFDYVPEGEQYELFSFLQGLQAELAAKGGRTLVSFPWDENLDYAAASRAADYVVLQGSRDTKRTRTPNSPGGTGSNAGSHHQDRGCQEDHLGPVHIGPGLAPHRREPKC